MLEKTNINKNSCILKSSLVLCGAVTVTNKSMKTLPYFRDAFKDIIFTGKHEGNKLKIIIQYSDNNLKIGVLSRCDIVVGNYDVFFSGADVGLPLNANVNKTLPTIVRIIRFGKPSYPISHEIFSKVSFLSLHPSIAIHKEVQ